MGNLVSVLTGRLFWKIFLWFWLTTLMMVFGGALGAAYLFKEELQSIPPKIQHRLAQRLQHLAYVLKHEGEEAAKQQLQRKFPRDFGKRPNKPKPREHKPFKPPRGRPLPTYILNQKGEDLLQREVDFLSPATRQQLFSPTHPVEQANNTPRSNPQMQEEALSDGHLMVNTKSEKIENVLMYQMVQSKNDEKYLIVIRSPHWLGLLERIFDRIKHGPPIPIVHLSFSFVISIVVCFWLSWYLSRPIHILRQASYKLAQGNLDYKVADKIGSRRDEIADLSIDFDNMAERLQTLLNSQKQLLNDTSHELRSPLARLQIALGLAEKKVGDRAEKELLRIATEVNRLDQLIGQILTVSRLEAQAHYQLEDYIDIAALLKSVIDDAQYEAIYDNKQVHLQCYFQGTILSNVSLLESAFDNVIRNAMHYTEENTQVEVILKLQSQNQKVLIKICDQGSGVSEEHLENLFEPFFRADTARDRSRGGYGLGLAIAKRAIQLHGGTISAYNQPTQGLCMEIQLPIATS